MLEYNLFPEKDLVRFNDLENVYILSFGSFLEYVLNLQNQDNNIWNNEIQHGVISNFVTFLKLLSTFNRTNASLVYGHLMNRVQQIDIPRTHSLRDKNRVLFQSFFNVIYDP